MCTGKIFRYAVLLLKSQIFTKNCTTLHLVFHNANKNIPYHIFTCKTDYRNSEYTFFYTLIFQKSLHSISTHDINISYFSYLKNVL